VDLSKDVLFGFFSIETKHRSELPIAIIAKLLKSSKKWAWLDNFQQKGTKINYLGFG